MAGRERGGIRARPGLSPLHHREWEVVPPERLEAMRRGMETAGFRTRTTGDTLWTPDGVPTRPADVGAPKRAKGASRAPDQDIVTPEHPNPRNDR